MCKKYNTVVLILLLAGIGCGGPSDRATPRQRGSENLNRAKGEGQGGRTGQGARGVGRGRARGGAAPGGSSPRSKARYEPVSLTGEELDAIGLQTVVASYRSLQSNLPAMGKVVAPPRTKAIVSYAFPARISAVHVRLGDWVQKEQKVVTVQSEEVGNAKSDYYKAMSDSALAKRSYERQERLHDRGVGAEKDFLAAEAEYTIARSSLDVAEKKLHILGFTEEQVREAAETHQINPVVDLYAPISGKIVENNAVLGAMIDQSNEILTIMNPNLLRVDAEIYEKDIAKIRVGQEVEVRVPAFPSQVFMGKIQYVSDLFKEDTRTITVHSEVANADYKLKPGMFADITIHLNHHDQVLSLPKSAILAEQDDELVFVQRGDEYVPLIIDIGVHENDFVQVLNGISEGDVVVTSGNFQLKSKMYEDIVSGGHIH